MKYLITESAEERTQQEAFSRGCSGATTKWWGIITHLTDELVALVIPDNDIENLTEDEKGSLLEKSVLENAGWFPDIEQDG